jgi:hypothetical protein
MSGQGVEPINDCAVAATLADEVMELVAAIAPAAAACHPHSIELADEVREDDGTVAGHYDFEFFHPV